MMQTFKKYLIVKLLKSLNWISPIFKATNEFDESADQFFDMVR